MMGIWYKNDPFNYNYDIFIVDILRFLNDDQLVVIQIRSSKTIKIDVILIITQKYASIMRRIIK